MSKVSIESQIAVVEAVAHAGAIERGAKGSLQKEHLIAAAKTLRWLRVNDAKIKAAIGGQS
jgi:hypothetical protein